MELPRLLQITIRTILEENHWHIEWRKFHHELGVVLSIHFINQQKEWMNGNITDVLIGQFSSEHTNRIVDAKSSSELENDTKVDDNTVLPVLFQQKGIELNFQMRSSRKHLQQPYKTTEKPQCNTRGSIQSLNAFRFPFHCLKESSIDLNVFHDKVLCSANKKEPISTNGDSSCKHKNFTPIPYQPSKEKNTQSCLYRTTTTTATISTTTTEDQISHRYLPNTPCLKEPFPLSLLPRKQKMSGICKHKNGSGAVTATHKRVDQWNTLRILSTECFRFDELGKRVVLHYDYNDCDNCLLNSGICEENDTHRYAYKHLMNSDSSVIDKLLHDTDGNVNVECTCVICFCSATSYKCLNSLCQFDKHGRLCGCSYCSRKVKRTSCLRVEHLLLKITGIPLVIPIK